MVRLPIEPESPARRLRELYEYVGLLRPASQSLEATERFKSGAFRSTDHEEKIS
jgi:hypothetical protein